jgi:hypothetical protein
VQGRRPPNWHGRLDVTVHVDPVPAPVARLADHVGGTTIHEVEFGEVGLPRAGAGEDVLLALDRLWTGITTGPRCRRLVVVDEAWTLMQSVHGARFLFRMAKASRRHWAGLTVITQDPADLLGTELGQAVTANAATQILLRHAPQAAPAVAKAFNLTAGERAWLTTAPRGHGLLLGGGTGDRVVFQALASVEEDQLITTDPRQLTDLLNDTDTYDTDTYTYDDDTDDGGLDDGGLDDGGLDAFDDGQHGLGEAGPDAEPYDGPSDDAPFEDGPFEHGPFEHAPFDGESYDHQP